MDALAGGCPSSSSDKKDVWRLNWKLEVVPKVRVFWWRVLKGIMPDFSTLSRRHVKEESICGICKAATETLLHALTECPHAKLFWTALKDVFKVKLPRLHPGTWSADILVEPWFTGREKAIVTTVMYTIWSSRNNWVHGGRGYEPDDAIKHVQQTILDLELPKVSTRKAATQTGSVWQGPPLGVVKVNLDGAICTQERTAGSGGVARDAGGFRGAWSNVYFGISDPLCVEALVFRDAVVFAQARGFRHVIFETDSTELVRYWEARAVDRSVIATVLQDVSDLLDQFQVFSLVCARRSANTVAHVCARAACLGGVSQVWLGEVVPEFLLDSLCADCNPNG